jgi:hypothetical protein
MSLMFAPTLPMPSRADIVTLLQFLGANVAVAKEDGEHAKAESFQALHDTAKALSERAVDLSAVTSVITISDGQRVSSQDGLYAAGCVADVQRDGTTLMLAPTPKPSEHI